MNVGPVMKFCREARKLLVAVAALLALVVASGLLDGQGLAIAQAVLGLLGAFGVYKIPNARRQPKLDKEGR